MKKLNHLRIDNLDEFIETFEGNTDDYYGSPFAILADLEKHIMFAPELENTILIPYKEFGDAIFNLTSIYPGEEITTAYYTFNSIVS